jgi:hypothetical protein
VSSISRNTTNQLAPAVFRVSFLHQGGPLRGPLAVGARSADGDRRPKPSGPPKAAWRRPGGPGKEGRRSPSPEEARPASPEGSRGNCYPVLGHALAGRQVSEMVEPRRHSRTSGTGARTIPSTSPRATTRVKGADPAHHPVWTDEPP